MGIKKRLFETFKYLERLNPVLKNRAVIALQVILLIWFNKIIKLQIFPVIFAKYLAVPKQLIIVNTNFIFCFDASGLKWVSDRIFMAISSIKSIEEHIIIGVGVCPRRNGMNPKFEFAVDVESGKTIYQEHFH